MDAELEQALNVLRAAGLTGTAAEIDAASKVVDALDNHATATPLQSALWYAQQGLPVFPLRPGTKTPFAGSKGNKDATTDLDQITAWFTANPTANIGLLTGVVFDVVDVDGYQGQTSRVKHWDDTFAKIDDDALAKVTTPRLGGMHLYVPATGDRNDTGIFPGVDYRGIGGYVVAPPSVTDIGRYRFLGTPDKLIAHTAGRVGA